MKTFFCILLGAIVLACGVILFDASSNALETIFGMLGIVIGTGIGTYGVARVDE